jgi:HEAT repeat protein
LIDQYTSKWPVQMAKSLTEIRSLARSHTRTALNVLVRVMRNKDATATARVSAANAILDRGWGKAPQAIQNGDDGAFELIHRIERVIVHPENPDS